MADEFDFWIINCGTIVQFMPRTERAREHCDERMPEDCPMMGRSYCVEHRFADDIIADLIAHAFNLRSI